MLRTPEVPSLLAAAIMSNNWNNDHQQQEQEQSSSSLSIIGNNNHNTFSNDININSIIPGIQSSPPTISASLPFYLQQEPISTTTGSTTMINNHQSGFAYSSSFAINNAGGGGGGGGSGGGGGARSLFPSKLRQLLDDSEIEGNQHIVSWLPHGRAFRVHKPKEFASKIVSRYFNHGQYRSFTRQLYHYGFGKVDSGGDLGAFFHPQFLRDKPALSFLIGRKKTTDSSGSTSSAKLKNTAATTTTRSGTGTTDTSSAAHHDEIGVQQQQQQQLHVQKPPPAAASGTLSSNTNRHSLAVPSFDRVGGLNSIGVGGNGGGGGGGRLGMLESPIEALVMNESLLNRSDSSGGSSSSSRSRHRNHHLDEKVDASHSLKMRAAAAAATAANAAAAGGGGGGTTPAMHGLLNLLSDEDQMAMIKHFKTDNSSTTGAGCGDTPTKTTISPSKLPGRNTTTDNTMKGGGGGLSGMNILFGNGNETIGKSSFISDLASQQHLTTNPSLSQQHQQQSQDDGDWFSSIGNYFETNSFEDDMFGGGYEPRPIEEMMLLSYKLPRQNNP